MTIVIDCGYDPPHTHEFPDDWEFSGANGLDPRIDPRWVPERRGMYDYINEDMTKCLSTHVPLCDDQALDEFTKVARRIGSNPKYLIVTRAGVSKMLPWVYSKATDELTPREVSND